MHKLEKAISFMKKRGLCFTVGTPLRIFNDEVSINVDTIIPSDPPEVGVWVVHDMEWFRSYMEDGVLGWNVSSDAGRLGIKKAAHQVSTRGDSAPQHASGSVVYAEFEPLKKLLKLTTRDLFRENILGVHVDVIHDSLVVTDGMRMVVVDAGIVGEPCEYTVTVPPVFIKVASALGIRKFGWLKGVVYGKHDGYTVVAPCTNEEFPKYRQLLPQSDTYGQIVWKRTTGRGIRKEVRDLVKDAKEYLEANRERLQLSPHDPPRLYWDDNKTWAPPRPTDGRGGFNAKKWGELAMIIADLGKRDGDDEITMSTRETFDPVLIKSGTARGIIMPMQD